MQRCVLSFSVFVVGLALPVLAAAQSYSDPEIPNLTGGWGRIGEFVEMLEPIPGDPGPGPLRVHPDYPHVDGSYGTDLQWIPDLSNPILAPATLKRARSVAEAGKQSIPHVKDEGMCQPSGVPMLWNRRETVQILQTPSQVTIINPRDQQFRRIYLNVPHSNDPGHTWYGESVGRYEGGDTLVIDTIGQNDITQIDRFGTRHSEKIHVVERIRISEDGQSLETQFTIVDPVAYTMPWRGRVRHTPRPDNWIEQVCAENNRYVGEVTVHGEITRDVPTPTDLTPDF